MALPRTIVPFGSPIPQRGPWHAVMVVVFAQIGVCTLLGLVVAVRRYRDASVVMIPAYILETFLWPDINERRVILAVPVILLWYVLGTTTAVRWVAARLRRYRWSPAPFAVGLACAGVVGVLVPLAQQFPRDYLFALGQDSSRPAGSRYMELLADLGTRTDVVESDYKYTTALLTAHRTADNAFLDVLQHGCSPAQAAAGLRADRAGYLLIGAVNKPDLIDSPCLFGLATTHQWAVRLLRTSRDEASVFELIGPGTSHPGLTDLLARSAVRASSPLRREAVGPAGAGDHPGRAVTTATHDGLATFTWSWGGSRPVSQVSVGEAGLVGAPALGVRLEVLLAGGQWETINSAPRSVGDGTGEVPFLLATLPVGTRARAVRVVVQGSGQAIALDVSALGPAVRNRP